LYPEEYFHFENCAVADRAYSRPSSWIWKP
jgi:hypothetical protein